MSQVHLNRPSFCKLTDVCAGYEALLTTCEYDRTHSSIYSKRLEMFSEGLPD
jgi:hypothetical protein